MIYTASYFQPKNHHGRRAGISRSVPKHFIPDDRLLFLAPSAALLRDCKLGLSEEDYTNRYREELKGRWAIVKPWLQQIQPEQDQTLLCWEHKGNFCHRNLVGLMVQKYCPDCWGGSDVLREPSHADRSICSHEQLQLYRS